MAKDGAAAQGAKALPKKAPVGRWPRGGPSMSGRLAGVADRARRGRGAGPDHRRYPEPSTQPVYLVPPGPLHCWSTFSHAVSSGSRGHC